MTNTTSDQVKKHKGMKASKAWRDKDQWEPKDIHSCSSCLSVCAFNKEMQLVVTLFCDCLRVILCACVSLCAVKKEIQEAVMVFVCVCLSLFVCPCLYVCMCFLCVQSKRKYNKP